MSLLIGFWHVVRFLVLAAIGLMVLSGVVEFVRQAMRGDPGATRLPSGPPPAPPSPKNPPEPIDLKTVKPGRALKAIRESFTHKDIVKRIDDVRLGVAEAHAALVADGPGALDLAAARVARCRWATGSAWRRHLVEIGEADAGALVARALADDLAPIVAELARRLAPVASPTMIAAPDGAPALACDACGKPAMTFGTSKKGVLCSTLSPVNTVALVDSGSATGLVEAIAARNASMVVHLLNTRDGCHVYCPECDRVYCKEHYAIDAKWSGSWHEATEATCPLGHWREVE